MKSFKKVGLVLGAALLVPGMANAGDFVVSGKADFVGGYPSLEGLSNPL